MSKRRDEDRIGQQEEERKHSSTNKQASDHEPRDERGFFFGRRKLPLQPDPRAARPTLRRNAFSGAAMRIVLAAAVALTAFAAWPRESDSSSDGRDLTAVNGSVTAEAGQSYDSVRTVNGAVRVGRGASAETAKTVNGSLTLEEDAKVGTATTVNGSLKIGEGAAVTEQASTVNGGIRVAKRARVGGDVSTVSGDIRLDGAEITGKIITRNGDIELTDGARVRGGIHVQENKGGWGWNGKEEPITVNVCATCVVDGDLRFDRAVELHVESGAKIGRVIGDEVIRR
jgi:DUF4097 and DUF4098 domain-containing protein YvlB